MTLIGKNVAEIEGKPHYQVGLFAFSSLPIMWDGVLDEPRTPPWLRARQRGVLGIVMGKRCIWPSCSVKLPPRPTCVKLSSPKLANEAEPGVNQLEGAEGEPAQPSDSTFSRLCAPISFPPFSRHSSSDDFRRPVCSSTSQERALDAEVLTAGRPWKKSLLDILGQKSAPFFLKVKPLCRLRTTSDSNTMSALWIIRIT